MNPFPTGSSYSTVLISHKSRLTNLLLGPQGFSKIVSDRWEFANEFFRRGEKELLCEIHRRKAVSPTTPTSQVAVAVPKPISAASPPSSNSGEEQASSSTTSPKNRTFSETVTTATAIDLSDENQKLKKDNLILSSELAMAKKQCQELLEFLLKHVDVDREKIESIMRGEVSLNDVVGKKEEEEGEEEEKCLKLFGVWVKNKEKRVCVDHGGGDRPLKAIKVDHFAQLVDVCSPGKDRWFL